MTSRVVYISSPEAREAANLLPSNTGRSSLVHSLVDSLALLQLDHEEPQNTESQASKDTARVLPPSRASRKDLLKYHSPDFIDALLSEPTSAYSISPPDMRRRGKRRRDNSDSDRSSPSIEEEDEAEEDDAYGLEYDCPIFEGLPNYVSLIAGGSLTAARELREGRADIAIHWDGGRHHATKSRASGFCYVNDIVLAIQELRRPPESPSTTDGQPRKRISKVLYIDLDLHHGDGAAEAFASNPAVVTLSMHLWSRGFYPSTPQGHLDFTGPPSPSPAAYSTLNLALPGSGLSDTSLLRLTSSCILPIFDAVQPEALVLQCGLDALAGDPCKEWNLSLAGYGQAVSSLLTRARHAGIPVLMLGGGGYNHVVTSKGWAYLTSIALDRALNLEEETVPEECTHWEEFEEDHSLDVRASSRRDENKEEDLVHVEEKFKHYAEQLAKRDVGQKQ